MAASARRVVISADSELARALDASSGDHGVLELDTGVALYEVTVSRGRRPQQDTEAIRRSIDGILASAGSWEDIDVDAFKAYIASRRKARSRPPIRL